MKYLFVAVLAILFTFQAVFAQAPYTEFKVGMFNPKGVKSGYLFGVNLGRMIDESLSWGVELNYFQRRYTNDVEVWEEQTGTGLLVKGKARTLEFTTRIIPVIFKLNYEHATGYNSPFYIRASAGLGWEFVFDSQKDYVNDVKKNLFFQGFGWQVSGGVGLRISSSANLFGDIFYNGSRVTRNEKKEAGIPTWEELDISGLGIKVGVSIVGFGW